MMAHQLCVIIASWPSTIIPMQTVEKSWPSWCEIRTDANELRGKIGAVDYSTFS